MLYCAEFFQMSRFFQILQQHDMEISPSNIFFVFLVKDKFVTIWVVAVTSSVIFHTFHVEKMVLLQLISKQN